MATDSINSIPPYVSFGVFKSTIEQLAESIVPTSPLDRRMLDGISGADYGALMSALRFLGLIDDGRKATAEYRTLVQASKDAAKFKGVLLELFDTKYKPIIGAFDLQAGSITELEKLFREYGVSQGQMLTKTVRFFVKAMTESGVKLSMHITKPKAKAPRIFNVNGAAKKREKAAARTVPEETSQASNVPPGLERMPVPGVPSGFIQYPADLTVVHVEMLSAAVTMLRAYATARTGAGKEKKP